MKFTAAVATIALGAASAAALPQPIDLGDGVTLVPRAPRMQARRAVRKSNPKMPVVAAATTNNSHVAYSTNWAGAVLVGKDYKTVKGTFIVPTPKVPSGASSSGTHSASAWVGIDGDTCQTAILQTGLDFTVAGGAVSYDAWYEWYPDYAYNFAGFAIAAGDSITVTAASTSKTAGSVTITNNSKGKTVTHSFAGAPGALCNANAEWIVEDFEQGGSLVPFADFGAVTFTGLSPSPSGAQVLDIQQSGKVLTSCSASSSSVTCSYA
ncbi:hypothetical protein P8C59_008959 [Phyllachora maydis]|uniref:Acid proteinase n=1 Tax=Phyllachora maydis TaxID=1825666 RepID=A0AAD9MJ47_9PEZI|nr:hypothetical protein P8C59_008959 [Phyllachora maydis]